MKKFILLLLIVHCSLLIENCLCQWQPDVRLTNNSGNSYTSSNNAWCIAANGNVLHAVWYDNRDGNDEIYYKRSTDGGTTWGTDTRLTYDTSYSWYPSIAVSGSLVHIVWIDQRDYYYGVWKIYYKRSTDGGLSWGADTRMTNNLFGSFNTSIAVYGTIVHVVWVDYRDIDEEIYYKRSTDGGINWGADTRLTNSSGDSRYPSVAVIASNVHVVWQDVRDGPLEIYYKHSTDGGINWGADTRLTNDPAYSEFPAIAVSVSLVSVVWSDKRHGNYEIFYKGSTDGGTTWGTDTRLTNLVSIYPSIAVSDSNVHIVWQDHRDYNAEIYYKRSTDCGINWGIDTRLTNDTSYSSYPSIAVSGSLVNVVWQDKRDGNFEIYYKRNPTGNVGIQNISTEIPSDFSLEQNYPNPFNPTTTIRMDIPKTSDAKLIVYDILGKEIETLVNEKLQPGTYEVTWDGSQYPSGAYFYKLTAGDFKETKRMILIK